MRITNEIMINKINMLLANAGQQLRVVYQKPKQYLILLNNGYLIQDALEYRNFHAIQKSNINIYDNMYHFDKKIRLAAVAKSKSIACSKGGKECQRKWGKHIYKNLNTGVPWNKDKTGLQIAWNKGLTKENNDSVRKISLNHMGKLNPMYGTIMTNQQKQHLSNIMKEKILNGTFTPNIHNSNTHWVDKYKGKKYRSLWEAIFHCLNTELKYESIRIPYIINKIRKNYIVDFEDIKNKILYEVKPNEHIEKHKHKTIAANRWANNNGYTFQFITQDWFVKNKYKILHSDISLDLIKKIQRYLNG